MKIGVIGLGLIGGSIFKKLSEKYDIVGVSSRVAAPNVSRDYDILRDCSVVFVCTPMRETLSVLDKLENYLSENTIVADVCSLKGFVSKKTYKYCFIPSHPMAGTEFSGWENSFPGLFQNAQWVITPINSEITEELEILEQVIEDMGANVVITTAEEHDRAVALISHMPMVIAQALCENIKHNKLAQLLASTGFKDTTRLALSNLQMAEDMVNLNRQNIENSISSLNDCIKELMDDNYFEKISDIKSFREHLYD